MSIPCRFGLVAVFVLAVVVVHWQTHSSGRTVDAATALVPHDLPRNISGLPPVPPTAAPPTALEQASPVFAVSGRDRPSSVDEGPRRVDHLFEEEFIAQAAVELNRGDRLLSAGDVNGALLAYMAAERHHGQPSAALQNLIGEAYQKYDNHHSAVVHFTNAIGITDNPVPRARRAWSSSEISECRTATEDSEHLLKLDPVGLSGEVPDTHLVAHIVMVRCHEPDVGVLCNSNFARWEKPSDSFPFKACTNGWRDDDDKTKFSQHVTAALRVADERGYSSGENVAHLHHAAAAAIGLRESSGVIDLEDEPSCGSPLAVRSPGSGHSGSERSDEGKINEHLKAANEALGIRSSDRHVGVVVDQLDRPDLRAYDRRTLQLLVEAACRDNRDPRYIEDLQRRLSALSSSSK